MASISVIALGLGLVSAAALDRGAITTKTPDSIRSKGLVEDNGTGARIEKWCAEECRTEGQHIVCDFLLHSSKLPSGPTIVTNNIGLVGNHTSSSTIFDLVLDTPDPYMELVAHQCSLSLDDKWVTDDHDYRVKEQCESFLFKLTHCGQFLDGHTCMDYGDFVSWCARHYEQDYSKSLFCRRLKEPREPWQQILNRTSGVTGNSSAPIHAKPTNVAAFNSSSLQNATILIQPSVSVMSEPHVTLNNVTVESIAPSISNATIKAFRGSNSTVDSSRFAIDNSTGTPATPKTTNTTTTGFDFNDTVIPTGHISSDRSTNTASPGFVHRPCSPRSTGAAPLPLHDTAGDFLSFDRYAMIAKDAHTPQGYVRVFQDAKASVQLSTFISARELANYDTAECAQQCDAVSSCGAFNIFVQREPTVVPGPRCLNPASSASFRCALYGSFLGETAVTDRGSTIEGFEVMIAGSNGYNRKQILPNRIDGFASPIALPGSFNISQTISGSQLLVGPYEPAQCAILCNQELSMVGAAELSGNSIVHAHRRCGFFNAFLAVLKTKPVGTFCALYADVLPSKNATQKTVALDGLKYEVAYSYGYMPEK